MTTYTWENYKTTSPEYQSEILKKIEDALPEMTWKDQAETFRGASAEVILEFLEKLDWRAQVYIYNHLLPVGAVKAAEEKLSKRAAEKLKIRKVKVMC